MPVVAVSGDEVIMLPHDRDGSHGGSFLAYVKVQEAAHLAFLVGLQGSLLELADADQVGEALDLGFDRHGLVDGVIRKGKEVLFAKGAGSTLVEIMFFRCLFTHGLPLI